MLYMDTFAYADCELYTLEAFIKPSTTVTEVTLHLFFGKDEEFLKLLHLLSKRFPNLEKLIIILSSYCAMSLINYTRTENYNFQCFIVMDDGISHPSTLCFTIKELDHRKFVDIHDRQRKTNITSLYHLSKYLNFKNMID